MAQYADWMGRSWNVVSSTETDPVMNDVLLFQDDPQQGKTIERWQLTQTGQGLALTRIEPWAMGCTWNADDSVSGTRGSQTFVITRDTTGKMLTCTFPAATARRRARAFFLGSVAGGIAGLLVGFANGAPPLEALAVGFTASFLSAVVTAYSNPGGRVADVWVASGGDGGRPMPPRDPSTEETGRQSQASSLRTAEA